MASPFYIGNRKVKLRFLIFIVLLILGFSYMYKLLMPSYKYTSIDYKKITMEKSIPVLLIRDEKVFNSPIYGKAIKNVRDGDTVNKDQQIAVLYKENYDEHIANQLFIVQDKILKYQEGKLLDQVLEADLGKLGLEIDVLLDDFRMAKKNKNLSLLSKKESEIRTLLSKKNKLLDLRTEPDYYLSKLYAEEASLLSRIKEWVIEVNAEEAGIISFTIDGYENILGLDALEKLTFQDFTLLMANKDDQFPSEQNTKAEHPFYKIVNPQSNWYAVFEIPIEECYYKVGDRLVVKLLKDKPFDTSVESVSPYDGKALVTLSFKSAVEEVINTRKTTMIIEKTEEGLAIPAKSIYNINDGLGVYVYKDNEEKFINIKINAQANGIAIVEPIITNQLRAGDRIRIGKQQEWTNWTLLQGLMT